jgi:hypothetical protein
MGGVGGYIILSGRERFGDSGGSNRQWYRGYYVAKGKGKAFADAYCERFGPPPGKSGGKGKGKTEIGWEQLSPEVLPRAGQGSSDRANPCD